MWSCFSRVKVLFPLWIFSPVRPVSISVRPNAFWLEFYSHSKVTFVRLNFSICSSNVIESLFDVCFALWHSWCVMRLFSVHSDKQHAESCGRLLWAADFKCLPLSRNMPSEPAVALTNMVSSLSTAAKHIEAIALKLILLLMCAGFTGCLHFECFTWGDQTEWWNHQEARGKKQTEGQDLCQALQGHFQNTADANFDDGKLGDCVYEFQYQAYDVNML